MTNAKEPKPSAILGDWFVSTPESEAMLAEEVAALRKNENDRSRALHDAYIWRVYNTPELHGSYCPCEGCESISGPLPGWVHEIGQRATRPIIPPGGES